jgi:hypothetical protein
MSRIRHAEPGLTIRAPGTDALDFRIDAVPHTVVSTPGETSSATVLDQVVTTAPGSPFHGNYSLTRIVERDDYGLVERSAMENLNPDVATLNDGFLTRLTDGTATVRIKTPLGSRAVQCNMTQAVGDPVLSYVWANGSLAKHASDAILSRLDDGDPATILPMYSVLDYANHNYVRNPNFWGADLPDITAIVVGNSVTGPYRAGVAVTDKHVMFARHYPLEVGHVLYFVDSTGAVISRTVQHSDKLTAEPFNHHDIGIASLSSPLPETISHCLVLPANAPSYIPNATDQFLVWGTNAIGGRGSVRGLWTFGFTHSVWFDIASATEPRDLEQYYVSYISGDSGSPMFMVINNRLVLLGCLVTGLGGSVTDVSRRLTEVNALIQFRDPSYSLTQVDLSSFPSYS